MNGEIWQSSPVEWWTVASRHRGRGLVVVDWRLADWDDELSELFTTAQDFLGRVVTIVTYAFSCCWVETWVENGNNAFLAKRDYVTFD